MKRYWIWKAQQAAAQRELWTDKEHGYYFCNIVTVRPDAQGRGIGRKLFEVVTDRADREGVKCYLESSKSEPNVRIYEKLGFRMVKTMDCEDAGDVCRVSIHDVLDLSIEPDTCADMPFQAVLHDPRAKDKQGVIIPCQSQSI